MLKCEKCNDTYFTSTPELFQQCESCGGKLTDLSKNNDEEENNSVFDGRLEWDNED